MFDMLGHEDKVLCVDWSVKDLMLTGSADNTFKMYNTQSFLLIFHKNKK